MMEEAQQRLGAVESGQHLPDCLTEFGWRVPAALSKILIQAGEKTANVSWYIGDNTIYN